MLRGLSGKVISINLTDVPKAMVIFGASPETGALMRLTAEENAFYDQLRQNELDRQIRMEQEKIGFKWVRFVKSNFDGICKLTIICCFFE